jgi:WD40 repeat protein
MRLRDQLANLADEVLEAHDESRLDLRELLRLCSERLDAAARKVREQDEAAARIKAKAEAAQKKAETEARKAEERANAEAAKEAKNAKAEAERAKREAVAAAKAAEEAQRLAGEAEAKAKAEAEAKAKRDEAAGKKRAAEEARQAEAAERRAAEAAAKQAARAEREEAARAKAEAAEVAKRRKAEEKQAQEARRQADQSEQRALGALNDAVAAAARAEALGAGQSSGGAGQSSSRDGGSASSPATSIAAQRMERGANRLAALKTGTWRFGAAEANSDGEEEERVRQQHGGGRRGGGKKEKEKEHDGLSFTISYGSKDTTAIGSAAQEADEEAVDEAEARRLEVAAQRREAKEAAAHSLAEEAEKERLANMAANLAPWARGGARSAELAGSMTVQSDCLDSDGGDTLVCVGGDGESTSVTIFSVSKGTVLKHLHGHTDKVLCVAIEGNLIASGGKDRCIRLWSKSSGSRTATLLGCQHAIHGLALRGGDLLSGEGSPGERHGTARLWSVSTGKVVSTYDGHRGAVWSVALAEGVAVSASHDATAKVWPLDAHTPTGSVPSSGTLKHPEWVSSVSSDGAIVATGCGDGRVRVWSLATFACDFVLHHSEGGGGPVFTVRLLGGGALASGGQDETVKLWSTQKGEHVTTLEHGVNVRGIASAGAKLKFIASAGGKTSSSVVIWRPAPPERDESATSASKSWFGGGRGGAGITLGFGRRASTVW